MGQPTQEFSTTRASGVDRSELCPEPSNKAVAARLGVCGATVGTWRKRFLTKRLDGLVDDPRPGTPRTVGDADIERVITRTLETKPAAATHWSTRGMAKATGLSQSTISRIWRAFGLKPHLTGRSKSRPIRSSLRRFAMSSVFISLRRENALVLTVDEKSQIQALDRTHRFYR